MGMKTSYCRTIGASPSLWAVEDVSNWPHVQDMAPRRLLITESGSISLDGVQRAVSSAGLSILLERQRIKVQLCCVWVSFASATVRQRAY